MLFVICLVAIVVIMTIIENFRDTTTTIYRINNLINKDRSVCDFINILNDWVICPIESDGIRIVIYPQYMPRYYMYITYKKRRPTTEEIKHLYHLLTDNNSIVTKAHKMGMPVGDYIDMMAEAFEEHLNKNNKNYPK